MCFSCHFTLLTHTHNWPTTHFPSSLYVPATFTSAVSHLVYRISSSIGGDYQKQNDNGDFLPHPFPSSILQRCSQQSVMAAAAAAIESSSKRRKEENIMRANVPMKQTDRQAESERQKKLNKKTHTGWMQPVMQLVRQSATLRLLLFFYHRLPY